MRNDEYKLTIEKLIQGGIGLAHLPNGQVCFVEGVLPLEECIINLYHNKKDFTKGKVIKILKESPDRVKPKCPYYKSCGGCNLQHIEDSKQVFYLEEIERDNFRRIAHIELPSDFKIYKDKFWNYRNRAKVILFQENENSRVQFGFRKQDSHEIVPVESCPILTLELNHFLKENALSIFKQAEKSGHVLKRKNIKELSLNLFDNGAQHISYYYSGMTPKKIEIFSKNEVLICGEKIYSDASVFFQSNLNLLPQLVTSIKKSVEDSLSPSPQINWLIDLYSGVGFFATILKDNFKKITTVERDKKCLYYSKINLSKISEKVSIKNVATPAEEWLKNNVVQSDATLIVDPPRTGLTVDVINSILKSSIKNLLYVSCNPITLARDATSLFKGGFNLIKAEGYAFYPQTPHLEMLFVFSRE